MKAFITTGSESDKSIMQESQHYLKYFAIYSNLVVASAHRTADVVVTYSSLPVLSAPFECNLPGGINALYSSVQMPAGVPMEMLATGNGCAGNAAIPAASTFTLIDENLSKKLNDFKMNVYKLPA